MSETVHDRVGALLETATAKAEGASTADDDESTTEPVSDEDLREAAAEAAEMFDGDSREVLDALSLGDSVDDEKPRTVPEAIVSGDTEKVADLRTLIALAKLSEPFEEGDEDAIEEHFESLRSTVRDRSIDEGAESEAGPTDEGAESEAEQTDEGSEAESAEASDEGAEDGEDDGGSIAKAAASAVSDAVASEEETEDEAADSGDDSAESGDDSTESDGDVSDGDVSDDDVADSGEEDVGLEDRLREAMAGSIGDFGDEIGEAKAHLERLQSDDAASEAESETAAEDEAATEAEPESGDDDSLFGFGDESDGGVGGGGGGSGRNWTMHSTMAPPPSKRADMRAVARHSTMPRRRD